MTDMHIKFAQKVLIYAQNVSWNSKKMEIFAKLFNSNQRSNSIFVQNIDKKKACFFFFFSRFFQPSALINNTFWHGHRHFCNCIKRKKVSLMSKWGGWRRLFEDVLSKNTVIVFKHIIDGHEIHFIIKSCDSKVHPDVFKEIFWLRNFVVNCCLYCQINTHKSSHFIFKTNKNFWQDLGQIWTK